MPVYLVTGKLGGGKSLGCVSKIRDYLNQNRAVATNLDLTLEKLINPFAKNSKCYRIPDKPNLSDLENLPDPYTGEYDEEKSGLIVLDECGTWLNTREYRDKSRQPFINKLLHIRKAGWDVMFIIQHIDMVDKQVREGLGEHVVTCQRTDRLALPFIGFFAKLLGFKGRPPKMHLATVRYGTSFNSPIVDRWFYNGSDLYDAYDTRQVFGANDAGLFCYLPPNQVYGQFTTPGAITSESFKKSVTKFSKTKFPKRFFFVLGVALTFFYMKTSQPELISTAGSSTDSAQVDEVEEPEEQVNRFDDVRIIAFIEKSNGFEYYFSGEYEPERHGFRVRAIDECSAKLIKDNESHIVNCHLKTSLSGG